MIVANNFSQQLITKIKDAKIAPKPKWQFLLRNYLIWVFGLLALLIGAAAMAMIIFLLKFNDWEIYDHLSHSLPEFILLTLPYFWLVFLGLFIFIVYYNFKHTRTGYRYSIWLILLSAIIVSAILGVILFGLGVGEKIDNILGGHLPFYEQVLNRPVHNWFRPDRGRLAGVVKSFVNQGPNFILIDHERIDWQVDAEAAQIYPGGQIIVGQPLRILGQVINDHQFKAERILPVRSGRGFWQRFDSDQAGGPGQPIPDLMPDSAEPHPWPPVPQP